VLRLDIAKMSGIVDVASRARRRVLADGRVRRTRGAIAERVTMGWSGGWRVRTAFCFVGRCRWSSFHGRVGAGTIHKILRCVMLDAGAVTFAARRRLAMAEQ
jgi:hypothetical protein